MTSAAEFLRSRLLPAAAGHKDLAAGVLLVVFSLVAVWDLVSGGVVVSKDPITQYYPWYSYLGERLRSGDIPAWNPHQFAGAPFAADPLSGWTYLPAMILFTILPLSAAAATYVFTHLFLAGLFTYALARTLRVNVAGALLAAVAYAFNSFMYWRNLCCSPYAGVMMWLPLAILGAELAIRSPRWPERGLWWGVGGLALSQILAVWPGQGSYYALIALGGYVAYRTLLSPPGTARGIRARLLGLLVHGGGVLLFGFGLAAAGLLPRLEYQTLSNLADGYANLEGVRAAWGGWTLEDLKRLPVPGLVYPGLITLALALAAPLVARDRHAVPFFAVLVPFTLILAGQGITPLHWVLYHTLPKFEWIHPHGPERIKVILYLGFALLAGATLSRLGERGRSVGTLVVLPALTLLFLISRLGTLFTAGGDAKGSLLNLALAIPAASLLALVVANACVVIYAFSPVGRRVAALLVVLLVFADLFMAGRATVAERATVEPGKQLVKIDLSRYYEPTGAARFLGSRTKDEPARYFGFGPYLQGEKQSFHYNNRFTEKDTTALLASNLGIPMGLQSIQGYNPVQIARYYEYVKALNKKSQGYHNTDVYPEGLDSPLLDLLNVRYIIVPTVAAPDQSLLQELKNAHPTVYSDDRVDVLENRDALPRAWIVHSARQVAPKETLELLSSGAVDPRRTALLEQSPPDLAAPENASADRAVVTMYEADRIRLKTTTGARGLLVLSEAYYPAWKAYVDGQPVPLYAADHVLRAVPLPAGEHTVDLRYESWSLRVGLAISLLAYLLLVGLAVAVKRLRRAENTTPDAA
ncbi:MAG: YfhO family protein [Actinomycetota bacterium]|nr:YfhO family protein [Actinomycetota bacterium]